MQTKTTTTTNYLGLDGPRVVDVGCQDDLLTGNHVVGPQEFTIHLVDRIDLCTVIRG